MSSSTVFEPLRRTRHFIDRDGILSFSKSEDDDVQLRYDWSDYSGETLSSVAYDDSGVTTSAKSVSGNISVCTVTGIGYVTLTATFSTGRTKDLVVRYYDVNGPKSRDYA